jgi:hypothetical protein
MCRPGHQLQRLSEQITDLTNHLTLPLKDHAATLMGVFGAGPGAVSQLLITAGDNRSGCAQDDICNG